MLPWLETPQNAQCWGNNIYGQVGQLDNEDRGLKASDMGDNLSSVLLGAFEVSEVAAGEHFSCALSFDGQVKVGVQGLLGLMREPVRFLFCVNVLSIKLYRVRRSFLWSVRMEGDAAHPYLRPTFYSD